MDTNINSAKALQVSLSEKEQASEIKISVAASTIEASKTLKQASLSIQNLNDKLEFQIELQKKKHEAQNRSNCEARIISWSALVISLLGTIFTAISFFK